MKFPSALGVSSEERRELRRKCRELDNCRNPQGRNKILRAPESCRVPTADRTGITPAADITVTGGRTGDVDNRRVPAGVKAQLSGKS